MRKNLLIPILILSSAAALSAQTAQGAPPTEATKNADLRDPFWPMHYMDNKLAAQAKLSAAAEAKRLAEEEARRNEAAGIIKDVELKWPKLTVTAISKSRGGYFAILKEVSGLIEEGATLRLTRDGVVYRWEVEKVSAAGVGFKKLDAKPLPDR